MVSVIIPVYNTEPYLEECFRSITNQTYGNLEIVIINDGSTDGSGDICRKWAQADKRIRYVEKENEGQGEARNLGMQMAAGTYLMFVDSDDYLDIDLVEKARSRMIEQDADICVFPHRYVGSVEKEWPLEYITKQASSMKDGGVPLARLIAILCNKMFSMKLVKEANIRMSNRMCEDLVFNAQMYVRADKISYLEGSFYNYRYMREGNLTTDYSRYYEVKDSIQELLDRLQRDGYFESYRLQLYEVTFGIFKDFLFRLSKREDLQIPEELKAQYPQFLVSYKNCLKKWFSSDLAMELQDKQYLLTGSYNLRVILHTLLLDESLLREDYGYSSMISMMSAPAEKISLTSVSFPNAYRERCIRQDINKVFRGKTDAEGVDYILIDLMDEINDLIEIREDCYVTESEFLRELHLAQMEEYRRIPFLSKERRDLFDRGLDRFAQKIGTFDCSVIIVKNLLCESHSKYYDVSQPYENADEIRTLNRELEWCYTRLAHALPQALVVDALEFQQMVFTHDNFSFGCRPVYYNQSYYQKMALKISRSVHDRKGRSI